MDDAGSDIYNIIATNLFFVSLEFILAETFRILLTIGQNYPKIKKRYSLKFKLLR